MFFRRLEKRENENTESDISNLTTPNKWLINLIGGNQTYSGENVDTESAMSIAAVYACVRILSRCDVTTSTIPRITWKKEKNKGSSNSQVNRNQT